MKRWRVSKTYRLAGTDPASDEVVVNDLGEITEHLSRGPDFDVAFVTVLALNPQPEPAEPELAEREGAA